MDVSGNTAMQSKIKALWIAEDTPKGVFEFDNEHDLCVASEWVTMGGDAYGAGHTGLFTMEDAEYEEPDNPKRAALIRKYLSK